MSYEGVQRYRNVDTGIDETLIDRRKQKTVPKEESTLYIEKLVPQSIYTFNISASFLDGFNGPVTSLQVETSAEGCQQSLSFLIYTFLYKSLSFNQDASLV